jgi:anti-anti-sigma regulatory factor
VDREAERAGLSVEHSVVVRLTGRLDSTRAVGLRAELAEHLDAVPRLFVLDLDGLEMVSADGVCMVCDVAAVAEKLGVRAVLVCRPDSAARRVFDRIEGGPELADSMSTVVRAEAPDSSTDLWAAEELSPGVRFAALTKALMRTGTVEEILRQVVDTGGALLPVADLVSITLRAPDGTFTTAAYTDPAAAELDRLQYDLDEGPCHDAAQPEGPEFVSCPDLLSAPVWPVWAPAAAARGWRAVLATALIGRKPGCFSGALNLYSRKRDGLRDIDRDLVLLLATHATLAIAENDAMTRGDLRHTQMRAALDSRDVIGQAKGIMMARRGLTSDEAFDLLRRTSQQLNVKLVHVAHTLATRHTELDEVLRSEVNDPA